MPHLLCALTCDILWLPLVPLRQIPRNGSGEVSNLAISVMGNRGGLVSMISDRATVTESASIETCSQCRDLNSWRSRDYQTTENTTFSPVASPLNPKRTNAAVLHIIIRPLFSGLPVAALPTGHPSCLEPSTYGTGMDTRREAAPSSSRGECVLRSSFR